MDRRTESRLIRITERVKRELKEDSDGVVDVEARLTDDELKSLSDNYLADYKVRFIGTSVFTGKYVLHVTNRRLSQNA